MINCMLITANAKTQYGHVELLDSWREDTHSTIWLDINGHDEKHERELLLSLGCHTLAIDDAFKERCPPKIELFDDYIFMLYRGLFESKGQLECEHLQISFLLGNGY